MKKEWTLVVYCSEEVLKCKIGFHPVLIPTLRICSRESVSYKLKAMVPLKFQRTRDKNKRFPTVQLSSVNTGRLFFLPPENETKGSEKRFVDTFSTFLSSVLDYIQ